MTIKGLHRNRQTPGLARAGIIRLGYKAKKCQNKQCGQIIEANIPACPNCGNTKFSKDFPRESPYFVLADAPELSNILGPEPTELRVYFPFDDIERVFPNYMQMWQASSLVCRGDGEMILYAIQPQTGKVVVRDGHALIDHTEGRRSYENGQFMPCPGLDRNLYPRCQHCKPNAILIIMLRDVPRLAYYQISTTSIHNIVDLPQQLEYVRDIVQRLTGTPHITGVPFILRRVKRKISVPKTNGDGQQAGRQRTEKYFLELEIEPEWVLRMMTAQRRLADPMQRFEALPPGETLEHYISQPERYAEPPVWEPKDYDNEPEAEIVEGEAEELEYSNALSDNEQSDPQKQLSPQNGNKSLDESKSPYKFPSRAAEDFYNTVQAATSNGYDNPYHFLNTLGGQWFNFMDEDLYAQKLDFLVSHAREKQQQAEGTEQADIITEDELPF